jgi:hypothetical protein
VSDQQKQRVAGQANRLPWSLASLDALQTADVELVVKQETCSVKTDAVFLSVCLILGFIPEKQA